MNIYTENKNDIIHETSVDFVLRPCTKEIHIVQYDKSLPIVKVELFRNGERYVLPENAAVNIRVGKLDHTFVYESVLGTNEERNIVYFEISEQMALIPGKIWPVLEVIENEKIACSSPLCFIIERNPIQEGQIESHDHFPIIYEIQGAIADHELRISNLEQQVSEELVTLHTNQNNITGEKTFNNKVLVSNTGTLSLYYDISDQYHATNKKYVDMAIQSAVEGIEIRSDVIDILGTYQDLQNYDISDVRLNDLIKIISDETHNNATSYYRWQNVSGTNKWNFVASEGPYYTISKSEERFVNISDYQEISGEKWFTNIVTISHLFFKSIGDEEAGPAITYDSDYYGWFYNRVLSINIGTNELGFIQPEYYDGKTNRIEYVTPNQIRLINIADPISETDVSNKRYTDRKLELHTFNGFVGGSQVHEQIQNGQIKYCQSGTQTSVDPSKSPIINIELTQEHISSVSNKKAIYIKKIHIEYELDSEIGVNKIWEHEFTSRIFGSGSSSDDINPKVVSLLDTTTGLELEWTLIYRPATGKQYYGSYNTTKGQQFGSNANPSDYISLYTTSIQNATIKNVWIEVSGNSGTTAKIKLTLVQDKWTVNNIVDPTITANNEQYIFYHEGGTHLGAGSGEIIEYSHIFLKKENDIVTSIVAKSEYLYIEEDFSKESDTYRLYKYVDEQMQEVSKTRLGTTSDTAYRGDYGQDNYEKLKEVREINFTFTGVKTFSNSINIQGNHEHNSYNFSTFRIDQEKNIDELQIKKNGDVFSLLSIVAPEKNPKESTLCVKVENSGEENNESYFMDISAMNYGNVDEDPECSIYIQSRNASIKPNFNIGYTDETQTRHKKLIINPDALPMMFKNNGILVKNTNDPSIHNWSDATLIDIRDINKKLDKFTDTTLKVYSHGTKENLDFNEYITPTDQAYANTLVMRDQNGKFRSVTPNITVIDNTVATTEFVNSYSNEKTVKLEPTNPNQNYDNSIYQVYGHMPLSTAEGIKGNLTYCFNISNVPQFSNIPQYNEEGRLKTNDPFENNDATNKKYVDDKVIDVQTNIEKSISEVLEVAEGKTKTIVVNNNDTLQTLKSANSVHILYPDGTTRDVTNNIKENDYDGYTFGNAVFGSQNDTNLNGDFLIFRNNPFKRYHSTSSQSSQPDYYIYQWKFYLDTDAGLNIGDVFLNINTDTPDFWLQNLKSGKIGILETRKIDLSNKVTKNADITGATKCKITYDSKGLVTAGSDLTASDIPSLDASKIISGTFADDRIASASIWNAKTKVTLNGSTVANASIYAPITSGTSGQYLKSNGSGTPPTWVSSGEILGGYTFELNLQEGGAIRPNVHLSIVAYKSDGTYSTHDLYSSSDLGATNIKLYNVAAVKIQCVSMGSGNYAYNTIGSGHVFGTIIDPSINKIWDSASISGLGNGDQANLILLGNCSCTIVYESN